MLPVLQELDGGPARYCIDAFEAHLVVDDSDQVHPAVLRPVKGVKYRAASAQGVLPQAYINRIEAAAACDAAGKRLCGAAEWYRACVQPSQHRAQPGGAPAATPCNLGKPHLLHKLFGNVTYTYNAHYNSPKLNLTPGFLAKTGEHPSCVSGAGTFDQVGNLHEWVADDVSARLKQELPLEKGDQWLGKRGMGVFMGGYFSSRGEHGEGCMYATATHAPDYHDYSIGFRCCADL